MNKANKKRLIEIVNHLFYQTDRAAAVVAGCILDDLLKSMLTAFFLQDINLDEKMFKGMAPLSTFSAKINIAYCTGLINKKQYNNLMLVKKIRDLFAHSVEDLTFDTPKIRDRCIQLKNFNKKPQDKYNSPKEQFKVTVTLLSAVCLAKSKEINHLEIYKYKTIKQ